MCLQQQTHFFDIIIHIINDVKPKLVSLFASSHTTGTYIFSGSNSVNFYLNFMNVGVECALCSSVGVANVVSAGTSLATNNAYSTHNNTSEIICLQNITQSLI